MGDCVIGLDVGTQGARAMAVSRDGQPVASASEAYRNADVPCEAPLFEQRPEAWWEAAVLCLRGLAQTLDGHIPVALSVDSTSGTFLPVDAAGRPIAPAIMYNDGRADAELAAEVQDAGRHIADKLGYRFPPAFALPKMLWLARNDQETFDAAYKLLHAADWLVGQLTGRFDVSDSSNALKTGYDLEALCWPAFIPERLGIPLDKLPEVATPGQQVGALTAQAAAETGLLEGLPVIAGATDGTASFLASGACAPGEWNTTLGTTLVFRGVSPCIIRDPEGRFYCHRHPEGHWLPGGASNIGGECLETTFAGRDLTELDRQARAHLPTELTVFPLARQGERAPFVSSVATGFTIGEPSAEVERFAGLLEGVALVEAWCYDVLGGLGAPVGDVIRTTGGGSRSGVWLQVRADVLQRRLERPALADAAMGSALLAASGTLFARLGEAAAAMVRIEAAVEPNADLAGLYAAKLSALRAACAERGYLAAG